MSMAAGDGLISMTPTSIAYSGTSASINADGGVDFTAVTSLSLNGVFTSDYDNYLLVCENVSTAGTSAYGIDARYRAAGTDASGANYAYQYIYVNGGSFSSARSTSQSTFRAFFTSTTQRSGGVLHVYGPALAQPTASRAVSALGTNSAAIFDEAATHSLSTSYDGITLIMSPGDMTGTVHVFGYEE